METNMPAGNKTGSISPVKSDATIKLVVEVDAEAFERGTRRYPRGCPVSVATRNSMLRAGLTDIHWVEVCGIQINVAHRGRHWVGRLPDWVTDKVYAFENEECNAKDPFQFDVELKLVEGGTR